MLCITEKKFRVKGAIRGLQSKYVSGAAAPPGMGEAPTPMRRVIPRTGAPGATAPIVMSMASAMGAGRGGAVAPIIIERIEEVSAGERAPRQEKVAFEEKKGISLADMVVARRAVISEEVLEELRALSMKYPLTPSRPTKGQRVFAYADIGWDEASSEVVYNVREPELTPEDKRGLDRIKGIIEEKIDVHFETLTEAQAIDYIKNQIDEIVKTFGISLTPEKRETYEYYILRDFIGLTKIQPLMNDGNIEDLSCDGFGVPMFVYHRDPRIGSVRTNVVFETTDELDSFTMKLAQRCKKSVSVSEPLLQGALQDGSRVQAVLGTDIARRGSNFTIRKFITEPLTPVHMMNFGTLDAKQLAYLWFCIEHNSSVLVSGPTAAGKTSLLNSLSLFIKPSLKIVTIEDTAELRLPHPNWVPEVARPGFGVTTTGVRIGEISMFDLLKASLRQRPDYIIVGEVRGEEAYVLFQELATGHAGMSTLHADSMEKVIDRLTTPPINLPAALIETLHIIVFVRHIKYHERYVRRVGEIVEILGYDIPSKQIITTRTFKWNASNDKFETDKPSVLLARLAESYGMSEEALKSEVLNRIRVLNWMKERGITYYKDVGRIISMYYSNPARVIEMVEAG